MYKLSPKWLPEAGLIFNANPNVVLPAGYEGTATHPRLVELFCSIPQERINEIEIFHDELLSDNDVIVALHDLYVPEQNISYLYAFCYENNVLNYRASIETLYLVNHYGPATASLRALFVTLRDSQVAYVGDSPLPDKKQIDKFIVTREWFLDENFMPPLDFIWNVSQNWEAEMVKETLIATNGEIKEIMRLLTIGMPPEDIKAQMVGEELALPESWINQILGILNDEDDEEKE